MPNTESQIVSHPEVKETISTVEQLALITRWTVPSVEVDDLIHIEEDKVAVPIEKEQWTALLAEVARVRADSQNQEGIEVGYYPEGFIVNGAYMYAPPEQIKTSRRRYAPTILPSLDSAMFHLFPHSEELTEFTKVVQARGGSPVDHQDTIDPDEAWALAKAWSEIGIGFFSDPLVQGYKRIDSRFGWPVIVFEQPEDLYRFQPYPSYRVPDGTQAVSFVATHMTTPHPGEILENTPFVACVEGCPPEIQEQHIRSQLTFAMARHQETFTPVLISKEPANLEEDLELRIKEYILELSIREKGAIPINWHKSGIVTQAILAAKDQLFTKKLRKTPVRKPFYIGNHPDRFQLGPDYEEKISEWLSDDMEEAFEAIDTEAMGAAGQIPLMGKARELWLVRLNYFSFFPLTDWTEAAQRFNEWEGRHEFRRSFNIPREIITSPNQKESPSQEGGEAVSHTESSPSIMPEHSASDSQV